MIAMDGPAASGKSTIGKLLAERLGYLFFDTGAMYRALTFLALERHISPDDGPALTALAEQTLIDFHPATPADRDGRPYTIIVHGDDITWQLRDPTIDAHVSAVAAHPSVRHILTEQQRRIGRRGHVVMVGRDIGTVVMPDADFKVYLDASVEARALRRCQERWNRGEPCDEQATQADLRERDRRDASRPTAPLRQAEDAIRLDTTNLTIPEVVAALLNLLEHHPAS
jgi:cytidylate kinase